MHENNDSPIDGNTSAFPDLSGDLSQLPLIPGGWETVNHTIGDNKITLHQPANPDLFLDDQQVLEANAQNDYMPFWAYLWPAAFKMAQTLQLAPWKPGSSVLELGSGLGLVGLSAMLRGDEVTFSDYDGTALHLCRMNALKNSLPDPEVLHLDWRQPIDRQFDVIIGCEVIYDAPMHTIIIDLLKKMLTPNGICWIADPGRFQSPKFYRLAVEQGFDVQVFDENLKQIQQVSDQGFQIFQLSNADESIKA